MAERNCWSCSLFGCRGGGLRPVAIAPPAGVEARTLPPQSPPPRKELMRLWCTPVLTGTEIYFMIFRLTQIDEAVVHTCFFFLFNSSPHFFPATLWAMLLYKAKMRGSFPYTNKIHLQVSKFSKSFNRWARAPALTGRSRALLLRSPNKTCGNVPRSIYHRNEFKTPRRISAEFW